LVKSVIVISILEAIKLIWKIRIRNESPNVIQMNIKQLQSLGKSTGGQFIKSELLSEIELKRQNLRCT
jgi:hypothetical protein